MNVPAWMWIATIVGLLVLLAVDLVIVDRKPHEVTIGEAARWVTFYVAMAALFGLGIWYFSGGQYATEFFAGYITEYSLSVDNLFIFLIIMTTFKVPAIHQHKVLLIGILLALVMRGIFIALGAAAISNFSWVFYLFGAFLIYTAIQLAREGDEPEGGYEEPRIVRYVKRHFRVAREWNGVRLTAHVDGRRLLTPMFIVVLSLGMTDLLFALDSIPAIYGLTQEPYLVLTANIFALMGLRQLYFLIGDLLQRLVYLSYGLAFLLFFIGVKLVLHAMHENELPFLNGGEHIEWAPEIPIWLSLLVIVGTLAVTAVASLAKTRSDSRRAAAGPPAL